MSAAPYTFKDAQESFKAAIDSGRLSASPWAWNYAGHFMYMGTDSNGVDQFKHKMTRRYLSAQKEL